jgi:hypothetical protein
MALVQAGNFICYGQAQAIAFTLGSGNPVKALEHPFTLWLRYAGAVVFKLYKCLYRAVSSSCPHTTA